MQNQNSTKKTSYVCSYCSRRRLFDLDMEEHQLLISSSPNGLRLYSDIHKCINSQIEANNIYIDADYNVRSQELLKIPEYKVKNAYSIPMPNLKKNVSDDVIIKITHIEQYDLHMVLRHGMLQTTVVVGSVNDKEPVFELSSMFEGIHLELYPSSVIGGPHLISWFQFLIDTVEILPPSHLGNLIEVLDYICERHTFEVQGFDKEFVRTILASHEVFVMMKENPDFTYLKEKLAPILKHDDFELIDSYLKILEELKTSSVSHLLNLNAKNYIHQLYILLIMEKEGLLSIERPGIVKS